MPEEDKEETFRTLETEVQTILPGSGMLKGPGMQTIPTPVMTSKGIMGASQNVFCACQMCSWMFDIFNNGL